MFSYEYKPKLDPKEKEDLYKLLLECDNEFTPSLSSRSSATDLEFSNTKFDSPKLYFESLLRQHSIITKHDGILIGILSFVPHYDNPMIPDVGHSIYVTTTCISPNFRRKGIGRVLYEIVETKLPVEVQAHYLTRRTWGTHRSQINRLLKDGNKLVKEIENHRGPEISTYYFMKPLKTYMKTISTK